MDADLDITDETFIVAEPRGLAAHLADPSLWRSWWPDLDLTVAEDRGESGIRWSVHGELTGTAEIWIEPWWDGAIVHWFVRAARRHLGRGGDTSRLRSAMVRRHKQQIHALKDLLERTRPPGMPRGAPRR